MGIFSYNVFPPGGANYPNISDINNIVHINPNNTTSINSADVSIQGVSYIQFTSNLLYLFNGGVECKFTNVTDVIFENISMSTNVNIKTDNVNVGGQTGKIGFFDNGVSAVQQAAIANANPATAHDVVNAVLNVLRSYGLIAT